ncbi:Sec9p PWA37_005426 [Arxiozyma heterogenica]|uniref:Sec9p n=1 Tax=Arxiozyma heterogenica TaxID=278026 RepID=UPI002EF342F2
MGIKKFFKIKPPPEDTVEQNRENLSLEGITVKNSKAVKREKFAAYGQFARERASDKIYAPPGYEAYARPLQFGSKEEESESNDNGDTDVSNTTHGQSADSTKKDQQKKRSIFGRKKSSKPNEEKEEVSKDQYDPYAVNTDLNAAPYSILNNDNLSTSYSYSNSNSRGSSVPITDPYSALNYKRNNENRDSNVSNNNITDPYSQLNKNVRERSYESSRNDSYATKINDYDNMNNGLSRGSSFNNTTSSDSLRNPYGIQNTKDNSNIYNNIGINTRRETSESVTSNQDGIKENSKGSLAVAAPYSGRINVSSRTIGGSVPINSNTIKQTSPSHINNPYSNMSDMPYGSYTSGKNSSNPYGTINNDLYALGINNNSINNSKSTSNIYKSNPYELDKTSALNNTTSTGYNLPTTTYDKLPNQKSEVFSNSVQKDNDLDFNKPLQQVDEDECGDDLNADLTERMQREQQQQTLEQVPYNAALETSKQTEYGGYYESPRLESRGFKTFEEVQREEEERQQKEEDEAVDELKQQIRFTKQSSVASTRKTLKMAQEAEMAGMNTLGMLGHQSEKLNNVERNLDLIKIQNRVADDKVAELKKLNRNILAVHVSNPFNSKRRQREREERLKNRKIEEKMMMEYTNRELGESTQRIENALNANAHSDNGIREKYQRQKVLEAAKKYQFENDEEDDEMEIEIDRNLTQIQQLSGRLKKLAVSVGEEIDAQQKRLDRIENDTDDLDIKINMNTTKLSYIK